MEPMIKPNGQIFKAYDVRGIYGTDFDDAFATALANKVGVFLKAKSVIVGRDARPSSQPLADAVIKGLNDAGIEAVVIGECSTPLFYYAVNARHADGGIMVTASHNPGEFNGFKIVGKNAAVLSGKDVQNIFETTAGMSIGGGTVRPDDAREQYAQAVVEASGFGRHEIEVGVQAPSVNKETLRLISEKTGIRFVEGKKDGFHVQFDDDADRVVFFEDQKKYEPDFVMMLMADHYGFTSVVHDLRFSRAVREGLEKRGIKAKVSRVGRVFIPVAMQEVDADFGAETSGHYFFKSFNNLEASECMFLSVLNIMRKEGKTLGELLAPYRAYAKSEEITLPLNSQAFTLLEEKYKDGTIGKLDGLTVEYPDWWFNLRPSNTEPIMRLVVEAKTEDLLKEKVLEVSALAQAHQVV